MIVHEGDLVVIPSPEGSGVVCGWPFEFKGQTRSLGVQIGPREAAEGQTLDTKVHSLTTEDMGIAQRTEAITQKIQAAIMAGRTEEATRLMAQLSAGGSFYQQEWEAGHSLLKPTVERLSQRIAQGLREVAALWKVGTDLVPALAIAWVQALPYGGLNGLGHPAWFLTEGEAACGARTYFLWHLLRALGQHPAIFGSQDYNHFMLGLEKGGGASKAIGGQKFYFLETTAPGFQVGQIPDDRGDLNAWEGFRLD